LNEATVNEKDHSKFTETLEESTITAVSPSPAGKGLAKIAAIPLTIPPNLPRDSP